jgi:hypothetical protein
MLSQTEGTIHEPIDVGPFTDRAHYRMAARDDAIDLYSLLHISSSVGREGGRMGGREGGRETGAQDDLDHLVFAFTSCLRFVGRFLLTAHELDVEVDLEGMGISPGETVELESFVLLYTRAPRRKKMMTRQKLFHHAARILLHTHLGHQQQEEARQRGKGTGGGKSVGGGGRD